MQKRVKSYNEYIETVVKTCSHKWLIMENRSFREYKAVHEFDKTAKLPGGKLIKIIPARCKSYSCPVCGMKKVHDLLDRIRGARLNGYRFFTLTMKSRGSLDDTERNLNRIVACFNKLNKTLRKKPGFNDLEYFRVVEIGKKTGMVHIHGVWNKYIPIVELSDIWKKITGDSYRADLKRIKSTGDVVNYLYKYLTKDVSKFNDPSPGFWNMDRKNSAAIFYENRKRRYQSSRKFFKGSVKKTGDFVPYYCEKQTPREVDTIVKYLIREYNLKKDNFDFELYDYTCFTDYLFNTS